MDMIRAPARRSRRPDLAASARSERGVTLVFVVVLGLFLVGIVGIAVDASYILTTKQQLQRAADASSLAAARLVKSEAALLDPANPFTFSRDAAIAIALENDAAKVPIELDRNEANAADGDIVVGVWDKDHETFTPDLLTPNAVRVRARRTEALHGPLDLFFGPVFGTATSDVATTATAVLAPGAGALVIILDPAMQGALGLDGTILMTVAGKIHVNSAHPCGIHLNGQPFKLQALQTSVVGGACYLEGSIFGPVVEDAEVMTDPLAGLLPDTAAWDAFKAGLVVQPGSDEAGTIDASGTYPPGFYPGGLSITSSDVVVLDPSSNPAQPYFMFGGNGMDIHGYAHVTAIGATIFIDQGAHVDMSGNGAGATVEAPDDGDFANIAFFHHRENTGEPESSIAGGGLLNVLGLIYVPGGELEIGGSPGKEIGGIIVNSLTNHGTTGFTITGKGIPLEPGEEYVFLVE